MNCEHVDEGAEDRTDMPTISEDIGGLAKKVGARWRRVWDIVQPYALLTKEEEHIEARLHVCDPTALAISRQELKTVIASLDLINQGTRRGLWKIVPGTVSLQVKDSPGALREVMPWLGVTMLSSAVARSGWTWLPPEYEIELTPQGTAALIAALASGSGAAWVAAELGVTAIPAGLLAALLALMSGLLMLHQALSPKNAIVISILPILLPTGPVITVRPAF